MTQGGFSTTEICRITGIPYDTLFGWMHSGLVVPSIAQPQGRGKRARWAFRDLVAIRTVQQLRQHGVSMQGLRHVVRYIQDRKGIEHPLSECWLVTDGDEVYMLDGKQLLSLLRKPGQLTLFHLIDMKRTTDDLRAKVKPLPTPRRPPTPRKQHERHEKRSMTA
jgi:DNA-binding transcriptional MerR regulator